VVDALVISWWGIVATIAAALVIRWRCILSGDDLAFSGWAFVIDAGTLVGSYLEGDPAASLVEMHRELAVHLGRNAQRNRDQLERRLGWFNVALTAFVVEVVALLVVLMDVV
jgi:hypothetical protein